MLTARQQDVLEFIRRFMTDHNRAPTVTEIAAGIGIKSRGVAYRYVKAIEQAGYIKTITGKQRNIRLRHNYKNQILGLPLMGKLMAQQPIKSVTEQDVFNLNTMLLKPNRFLLQIGDESLRVCGIFEDDFIVCELLHQANTGDIVVAIIREQFTVLRSLQWNSDGTATLSLPFTQAQPEVYVKNQIKIHGVYRGLFRLTTRLTGGTVA
jgi:repressor LexA